MTRKPISWRVQSDPQGAFDEIVVGTGAGLIVHAEMLDKRTCFIDVAGLLLWVWIDDDGVAQITDCEETRL